MDIRPCFECGEKYRPYVLSDRALCAICKKERKESERKKAAHTYYAEGYICCEAGEYDEAIRNYTKAIEIESEFANAYSARGSAYSRKGEYDRAITDYNRAIELDQNFAEAYLMRGIVYDRKKEHEKAVSDLNFYLKLLPLKMFFSKHGSDIKFRIRELKKKTGGI